MRKKDYEKWVASRTKDYIDFNYCVIALNGEAGEVAEWHKKYNLRGNPTGDITKKDLLEEYGDVLFYLTRGANLMGWSLSDIMDTNQLKIEKRIAEGKLSVS